MNETNPSAELQVTPKKRPYSRLAIASLLLAVAIFLIGVLGFNLPGGLYYFLLIGGAAFALGVGFWLKHWQRGWACVIIAFGLCIFQLVTMPLISKARDVSNRSNCALRLRVIGQAIQEYQADHDGFNPPTLETLVTLDIILPDNLICLGYDDQRGGASYIYRGGDLNNKVRSSMILAYDKPDNHSDHILNVLYSDGRVKKYDESDFWYLIEEDNEFRKKQGFAEKPMEITPRYDREGREIITEPKAQD